MLTLKISAPPGRYLTFQMKGQSYGISIECVREINRMTPINKVPQVPDFVAGVTNLRGKIIPVIDLSMKLAMGTAKLTPQTCVIVVESNGFQTGMIIDEVRNVVDFEPVQIEAAPEMGAKETAVIGIGKTEQEVFVLLDVIRCVGSEPLCTGGDPAKFSEAT